MSSSASTMTSGLRQPQSYSNINTSNISRLPQPESNSPVSTRGRRQSVIVSQIKPPSTSTIQSPPPQVRSRTMSDAPRPDFNQQKSTTPILKDRRLELRRSLYLEQPISLDDVEDSDEEERKQKFRSSVPLLDAYGVPLSPAKQQRGGLVGAASVTSNSTVWHDLPPSDLNQKIRVCVRKRPLSKKELDKSDKDVAPLNGTRSLQINEPK
jgi:hypothetical protein